MNAISYSSTNFPIRENFAETHNRFYARLANPGNWLTARRRIAIAAEVRHARACSLCARRKAALSPSFVDGTHESGTDLPEAMMEIVHRVVTDPGRLTRTWFNGIRAQGVSEEEYVEIIGTIVFTFTIDEFCRALALPLNLLPEPHPDDAWVAWIPADGAAGAEADLWPKGQTANVIRALSLTQRLLLLNQCSFDDAPCEHRAGRR